jgi:glycosyltransferase involved in cell wall biosynthesis
LNKKEYVLITPARNEEEYIEKTLISVYTQTIKPKMWIIVSDGSTDRTDEIIYSYEKNCDYLQVVRCEPFSKRNFASKVHAFNIGQEHLNNVNYDFIGNLDADVSLSTDYYERILYQFDIFPRLGIAGGQVYDNYSGKISRHVSSKISVNGMIQIFRRECFEEIGGYLQLERGGIDMIAEIAARRQGWVTRTFPNIRVIHNRRTGTRNSNIYTARYRQGKMEFVNGYHILFEMVRCLMRIIEKPYILSSVARFAGYLSSFIACEKKAVPREIIKYLRQEQLRRLVYPWK